MFNDYFDGIRSYGQALTLIGRYRLWGYAFLPALLSLIIGASILSFVWGLSGSIGHWLVSWYSWEWGSDIINDISTWIGGFLVGIAGILVFKYIVLIVVSPFMGMLSEKVERRMTGNTQKVPFNLTNAISDFMRGMRIALRNLSRELFFTLILLIFGLFPVIGWISPILIFLVQANYAGFGNLDYTLERKFKVRDSVRFIRQYRGLALGNGTVFMLLLMTGVGFLFAPPLATVAGTVECVKRLTPSNYEEDEFI